MLLTAMLLAHLVPAPVVVAVGPGKEPQVAIDARDRVFVAYGLGDAVLVSSSENGGQTYGTPVKVAEAGHLSLGMRRGPRIAVSHGTVTVTATYGSQGGGKDGDLLAWRSTDLGKTWTGPSRVNDVAGSGREGLHAMAVSSDGTLASAWLDLRSKGTKIYMSVSKDGGGTWSPNRLAYESPSGTVCQCCHPSLAFDSKGRLYIMFRNVIDGARDMYVESTDDLGKTFEPAKKLGTGTWMLDACPMDGGAIAISGEGVPAMVWRREGTVFETLPGAPETSFGGGRQPWAAASANRVDVIWSRSGRLYLWAVGGLEDLGVNGDDPVIASSPTSRLVIAAWTDSGIKTSVVSSP